MVIKHEGRDNFFFWLGKRLSEYDVDHELRINLVRKAYNKLDDKSDFPFEQALTAARGD
jgi:hypothetical protein